MLSIKIYEAEKKKKKLLRLWTPYPIITGKLFVVHEGKKNVR
jgi:hypothetical protein